MGSTRGGKRKGLLEDGGCRFGRPDAQTVQAAAVQPLVERLHRCGRRRASSGTAQAAHEQGDRLSGRQGF